MNQDETTIKKVYELVMKATCIAIFPHENPDADCIGSACGLQILLEEKFSKHVYVIEADPLTPFLKDNIYNTNMIVTKLPSSAKPDLFICLDTSNVTALTPKSYEEYIKNRTVPLINIDHHATNMQYGDVNIIIPECSSEGELLEQTLRACHITIPPHAAHNFLFGLIFDTQSFKVPTVNDKTLESAMNLQKQGAELTKIMRVYLDPPSFAEAMALKKILTNLHTTRDHAILWTSASKEDLQDPNFESSLQKIKSYLVNIKEAQIVATFKETDEGIDVSLRSKHINILEVAKYFHGGGHKNAAGFRGDTQKDLKEFEEEVIHKLEELLEYQQ